MTNRKNNPNHTPDGGSKAFDTEFGTEFLQSKKARKRAARERKSNS